MLAGAMVPRVPGNLVLGNLFQFRKDRIGLLTSVPETYGDIARLRFGVVPAYLVSAADLAHEVLTEKNASFMKGFGLSVFAKPLLGEGLLTSEGEHHKKQRRLVAPAFVHKRIAQYATTIATEADRSIERLRHLPPREEIDVGEEMMNLTFRIVGRTLFNTDLTGDAKEVGDALTLSMRAMMDSLLSVVPLPPQVPTPHHLRMRRTIKRLDEVVYRIIRERRKSGTDEGDFLSMLLLAQDDEGAGDRMTDEQVRDEVMTILLAGHETTANALAWTFYLLGKHQEVQRRLEGEVDAVLEGRAPTLLDLPRLPFTLAVFKEAMRLYPPAYMIARRALSDVTIGGHSIPRGGLIVINIIGMHRREKYFERALSFEPERFLPEREQRLEKHCYLPFGGGPRVCIGNHFALMEGQMLLAHLSSQLRFDLVRAGETIRPEPLVTLRPGGGVPAFVAECHPVH